MSHSEICPVCGGAGKIKTYLDPLGFGYLTSGKTYTEKTCHGCQGKGWITIEDKQWQPNYYDSNSRDTYMTDHIPYNHIPYID